VGGGGRKRERERQREREGEGRAAGGGGDRTSDLTAYIACIHTYRCAYRPSYMQDWGEGGKRGRGGEG
jgi:hypothetical protein